MLREWKTEWMKLRRRKVGMLLLAFLAMQNVYGRAFIIFLIIFKYVYFFTKIRTVPAGGSVLPEAEG